MKRKLEINWMELDGAFQTGSWEMQFYGFANNGLLVYNLGGHDNSSKERPGDRWTGHGGEAWQVL